MPALVFPQCCLAAPAAKGRRSHDTGSRRFHHPRVGDLGLSFETMQLFRRRALSVYAARSARITRAETTPGRMAALGRRLKAFCE